MRSTILLGSLIIANYFSCVVFAETIKRVGIPLIIMFLIYFIMDLIEFYKRIDDDETF